MIQRIQTIYLLIVSLVAIGFSFCSLADVLVLSLFLGVALLSIISVFSFKKRPHQLVLNKINILCNLILLSVFSWRVLSSSGENLFSEKGVQLIVPLISIVFLFLANKAIHRDEELVKSADRLR